MPPVRIVSFEQVAAVLHKIDKEAILSSQAQAFHAFSSQQTQSPQRVTLQSDAHTTLVMPARINTLTSVVKIVSVPRTNSKDGLPGMTVVIDNTTGEPAGFVNARLLTALRTAAGSALATRAVFEARSEALATTLSPQTLVVFGSGAQAKAHIQLITHVLHQKIQSIVICNRSMPRAKDLVQEIGPQFPLISVKAYSTGTGEFYPETGATHTSDKDRLLKSIVEQADIICTCTNSREPLFPGKWVQPGAHLNMVGSYTPEMHEVDQTLIQRAWTIVDARRECEEEAGEFIKARHETGQDGVLAELGQMFNKEGMLEKHCVPKEIAHLGVADTATASSPQRDVSIFKSVGVAAQDVAITALVLDTAEQMGLGAMVPF